MERAGIKSQGHVEYLAAFCAWAVDRGYLGSNSIEIMAGFDTMPLVKSCAMTTGEVLLLLGTVLGERRLLYEIAFLSGLITTLSHCVAKGSAGKMYKRN